MFSRFSPAVAISAVTVLLLIVLIGTLYWMRDQAEKSLVIYCAAAMKAPLEAVAADYTKESGQRVELTFGASQALLTKLEDESNVDLFLPADESYMASAKEKKLVSSISNLATMRAVVIVRPGYAKKVETWDDFLAAGKIGLADTASTAIGRLTNAGLKGPRWDALEKRKPTFLGDIQLVGNTVSNGLDLDAGIVFDAVALQLQLKQRQAKKPEVTIVKLKELDAIKARVQIGVVSGSRQAEHAHRFVSFLRAKDKGAVHLKKFGYSDIDLEDSLVQRPPVWNHPAMGRPDS